MIPQRIRRIPSFRRSILSSHSINNRPLNHIPFSPTIFTPFFTSHHRNLSHTITVRAQPWYLRDTPSDSSDIVLPEVPSGSPDSLHSISRFCAQDLGLQDIQIFDLSLLPQSHPSSVVNQPADYMIIGSGNSEKHVFNAGKELQYHLKHNYDTSPVVEGLVGTTVGAKARRRLLKSSNKRAPATDNDYGRAANSWLMCNTMVDGIFVHILTGSRRSELDLESLWMEELAAELELELELGMDLDLGNISSGSPPGSKTFSRSYSTSTTNSSNSIAAITTSLGSEPFPVSAETINNYIHSFETNFINPSIEDYRAKSVFYASLHRISPEIVSQALLLTTILSKYRDLSVVFNANMDSDPQSDLELFAGAIIDTTNPQDLLSVDSCIHSIGQFLNQLTTFSSDPIPLDTIIPLLIKATHVDPTPGPELSPSTIDNVIYNQEPPQKSYSTITLASNKLRDIIYIADEYTPSSVTVSSPLAEAILFSYGNSAHWHQFWQYWDQYILLVDPSAPSAALTKWVRLLVYISLRNDAKSMPGLLHRWNSFVNVANYRDAVNSLPPPVAAALAAALARLVTLQPHNLERVHHFLNNL